MSSQVIGKRDTSGVRGMVAEAPAKSSRLLRSVAIAYAASALIVFLAIVTQFVTAGKALFAPAAGGWEASWQAHLEFGPTAILIGSVLLIGFSVAARQPWRWTGAAVLLLALSFAQGLLVQLYDTHDSVLRAIATLHVVDAGVMFLLSFTLLGRGADALRAAFRSGD